MKTKADNGFSIGQVGRWRPHRVAFVTGSDWTILTSSTREKSQMKGTGIDSIS